MSTPPRKPPRPVPPQRSSARPGGSATPLPPSFPPSAPPAHTPGEPEPQPSAQPQSPPPARQSIKPPLPHTSMGAVNKTQLLPQGSPPPDFHHSQPRTAATQPTPSAQPASSMPPVSPQRGPRRRGRKSLRILTFLLVLLLAWPVGLLIWANGKITHIDALSTAAPGPYTTYLLAGSDSRGDGFFANDTTEGERADSIMLLTVPTSGTPSLISIPRDTYVEIPGHRANKINASYALGGPALLVETIEGFTGMKVNHFVEIGMGGVAGIVDALGTINLCSDLTVDDPKSQLTWTPGCHDVDGATALAFGRMRYQDPLGDIGRAERQRQIIQSVTKAVASPASLNPARQLRLIEAGVGSLAVDEDSNILTLGKLALAFRAATGEGGVRGAPPISSLNHQPGGVGSAVLITETDAAWFFQKVAEGTITSADTD